MHYICFPEISPFATGYLFTGFSLSTAGSAPYRAHQAEAGRVLSGWLPIEKWTRDRLRCDLAAVCLAHW